MSLFTRPRRDVIAEAHANAAAAEVRAIVADARRQAADYWADVTGTDYPAAVAIVSAMRAEASGTAYTIQEAS